MMWSWQKVRDAIFEIMGIYWKSVEVTQMIQEVHGSAVVFGTISEECGQ